jgi:membrane peptidoglycan carboxypeptidase
MWKKRINQIKKRIPVSTKGLTKAKLIKIFALCSFIGALMAFFGTFLLFAWYAKDLPRPNEIVRKEGFATKIYDRDGELLYDVFAEQRRVPINIEDVPEHLKNATVAIEDKHFYEHSGFDVLGWARAVYKIVVYRRLEGGSTLTQQFVKNVLLSPKRTLGRKFKEFVLAVQIENKYSKEEILQMYLNEAPYGGTAWGVEAAAEMYFGKKVSELDLVESAILAGLPQRPSFYSPFSDQPDAWQTRTKHVLRRMREDNYITKEQEEMALDRLDKVEFSSPTAEFKAPHFVMYVKRQLEEKYGKRLVEQGGLEVYTTLDWDLQQKAQKIVKDEIAKVEDSLHITNGAALTLDPTTGEILSMVGSKDFFADDYDGQVNVTLSKRQPGSAIKPLTYATALKKGYTPASMLVDAPTRFPGGAGQEDYVPKNYDGKFHGPVSIRTALGSSLNIPAVKMLALTGLEDVLQILNQIKIQ